MSELTEAQQQIEELKRERDEHQACAERMLEAAEDMREQLAAANKAIELDREYIPDLEKQLAEARIELEAAEQRGDEYKAALAEIHNRFCGENGEPCQVCRLKAEREEK